MAAVVKAKASGVSDLKRNNKLAYALLIPGLLWLAIFFVAPILTLVSTSTKVPGMGIGPESPKSSR